MSRATTKIILIFRLMNTHMKTLNTRFSGARTEMRISIWNACCRLCTSVVIRVMRPPLEYLSMFENENVWMFLNIALRRLEANPEEA